MTVLPPESILNTPHDSVVIAADSINNQSILDDILKIGLLNEKIVADINKIVLNTLPTYYSQHCEDIIIYNLFNVLGIEKPSYIDVGAFHPYSISNTALFYLNGSRGINVEPNPDFISLFNKERPDDINVNVAIGAKQGILPFYNVGSIWTLSYDLALFWQKQHFGENLIIKKHKEIQVITLPEIIEQHSNGKFPDFMSIDCEGLDYDILEICDFSQGKPLIICAEMIGAKANQMMYEKGFVVYSITSSNTIYVRDEVLNRLKGVL